MLLTVGAALTLALTGCHRMGHLGITAAAQAAEICTASASVAGTEVDLSISPGELGQSHIIVTTLDPAVRTVESQVIMATMGHGAVVDLTMTEPGRFEANTDAITMAGDWLIRTKVGLASGEIVTAKFRLEIGTLCLPATTPSEV